MTTKSIIKLSLVAALFFTGCTKDFEKVNVNPTNLSELSTDALFTRTMIDVSGGEYEAWRGNLIYTTQFVQQFASTSWNQGDKYFFDEGYSSALWDAYYGNAIKNLVNLVEKTKGNAAEVNYNSAGRILKAFAFLRLTDLYGDIPYSEASLGFLTGNFAPKYDEQKNILADMITDLDAAAKAFDATKPFKGDISSYNGNIALWKKAAYSLMLRVSMRMSKADQNAAKDGVAKAVAGGVFSDYTESFRIGHLASVYDNPTSHVLGYYNGSRLELSSNSFKFSKTFVDLLKSNSDPRLKILSVVRTGDVTSPIIGAEDDNVAIQKGLPNGTDATTIVGTLASYSQLRSDFAKADVANILITHAQTLFLLAEAVERGWTTGNAQQLFRDGVKSAINQLKLYNASGSLFDDAAINTFASTTVAYPAAGTLDQKLAAINTQYYIASLLDGYEPFANWRRSGYPVLTAVNYQGNYTGGVIPRRLQYPASEAGLNKANLDAAIGRQGANNFVTKVWWDK